MTGDRTAENQRMQRELHGETLHDRLRPLMAVHRVKMGNPRAHERMLALEHRATENGRELAPGAPAPPAEAAGDSASGADQA